MIEDKFDHIISQKLDNIRPAMPTDAWEFFQEKLDVVSSNQEQTLDSSDIVSPDDSSAFDQFISNKLQALTPDNTLPPSDWDAFREKLDGVSAHQVQEPDANLHADISNSFDQLILQKLQALESDVTPNASAWDTFEQKLRASHPSKDFTTSDFDQFIAQNLEHQYPAYNHQHWLILKDRLDQITLINAKILTYKMGELAILLVLWLFIGNTSIKPIQPKVESPIKPSSTDAIAGTNHAAAIDNAPLTNPAFELQPESPEEQLNISQSSVIITEQVQLTQAEEEIINSPSEVERLAFPSNPQIAEKEDYHKAFSASEESIPFLPSYKGLLLVDEIRANLLKQTIERALDEDRSLLASVDLLSTPLAKYADPNIGLPPAVETHPHLVQVSISMFGSSDYNRIITKGIKKYGLKAFDRFEAGYGGGFLVDFKRDRWGFQTGAIYSAKTIRPEQITHLGSFRDGFPGELLEEYDFNTINIPLNFTYDIVKGDKWRFYAVGGVGLQFVYEAKYYVVLDLSGSFGYDPLSGAGGVISTANTKSRLDDINFPPGLFENGTLKETSYITTNIGLGIERLILEDRWSVFVQPTYQHGLIYFNEGLGPFKDRLRTMSIFTGVRVRLIK